MTDKLYLNDAIKWCIARDGNRVYWLGVYIAIRLDCIGRHEMVSLKNMKLLNTWKRMWGVGD